MFPFLTKINIYPKSYLEIGVAEGHTLAAAVSGWELEELVLCDNWTGKYGGMKRENHQHIEFLLGQLHFPLEKVTFLDGASQIVIPEYFAQDPDRSYFDVIFIDGDHSPYGLMCDLHNTINHAKIIIIHDMKHSEHLYLSDVVYSFYKSIWRDYTLIIDHDLGYLAKR